MRTILFFVITFNCLLNVVPALESQLKSEMDSVTKEISRFLKLDENLNSNINKCLKDLNSTNNKLILKFHNETYLCVEMADKKRDSERTSLHKFHKELDKRMEELIDQCNHVEDDSEYLSCWKHFKYQNTKSVDDLKKKADHFLKEFENIEREEQTCISKSFDEKDAKFKIRTALYHFQNCLLNHKALSFNPVRPKEINKTLEACADNDAIVDFIDCLKKDIAMKIFDDKLLNKLKKSYKSLQTCVHDWKPVSNCSSIYDNTSDLFLSFKNLPQSLIELSASYSKEINDYDRNENTCLRHFITGIVFPDFKLKFDFEKCLKKGFQEILIKDNQDENLIFGFWNLRSVLWACRKDPTNTEECISKALVSSNEASAVAWIIQRVSEKKLKDSNSTIYKTFNNETDCIGHIFEKLKFRGLFMDDLAKNDLKICMDKRYVFNNENEKAIKIFKTSCTQYPGGPEFSKCVAEYVPDLNIIHEKFPIRKLMKKNDILTLFHHYIITLTGYIFPKPDWISIDFVINERIIYVLRVYFGFQSKNIVLSSLENGSWRVEQKYPMITYNLYPGSKFAIIINITDGYYVTTVNGIHLANFNYRILYTPVYAEVGGSADYIQMITDEYY